MSDVQSRNFPILCPICRVHTIAEGGVASLKLKAGEHEQRRGGRYGAKLWFLSLLEDIRNRIRNEFERDYGEESEMGNDASISEIRIDMAATVLSVEEMELLERVSFQSVVDADPNFQRCPNIHCGGIFYNDDPTITRLMCRICLTTCCWKCKTDTAHDGFSCAEYQKMTRTHHGNREQLKFEEMILKEKWRRCPNCTMVTAKNEGCNKMACEVCKAYWCFVCGKKLNKRKPYLHFASRWSKCNNKLFQD
ncbi:hypothetical protein HDU98_004475 [Podochytrium sp. JEL0797]|nr:hypothetical protein HDU98_004475 [Podochytrium sp. JEL0797]